MQHCHEKHKTFNSSPRNCGSAYELYSCLCSLFAALGPRLGFIAHNDNLNNLDTSGILYGVNT